jgi:integrase
MAKKRARRYLAATPYERLPHVLCVILLMLRDGEFRGMRWGDLDEDEGTFFVGHHQSRQHGFTTTKTASSQATVPVPQLLLELLREHRKRQAELRLRKGEKWQDHELYTP